MRKFWTINFILEIRLPRDDHQVLTLIDADFYLISNALISTNKRNGCVTWE